MLPVDSSGVDAVGYDEQGRELYVRFHDNPTIYAYEGVPLEEYQSLLASDSIGGYVNTQIKPRYTFRRIRA